MVPPLFLHEHREAGCFSVLPDRKFYRVGNLFIKRTMRRHEWQKMSRTWVVTPSASIPQRYRNDVAIQQYLRERTNIPLPAFAQTFEDDGAMYLVAEFVEGVGMNELPEADRRVVQKELQQHIETLKSLRSDTPGVPGISDDQLLVAPPRLFNFRWNYHTCWRPRSDVKGDFVFCHGDLGQHNVLVDPKTLKIAAIIDWEFGGFWPEWFEWPFWTRPGGSYAHEGEEDDTERCREWLLANCEAVEQSHLPTLKDKLGSIPSTPEDSEDEGPSEKGRTQGGKETTALQGAEPSTQEAAPDMPCEQAEPAR